MQNRETSTMEFVGIPLSKCKLFLTEVELIALLAKDVTLWRAELKRGRNIEARQKQQRRGLS